MRDAMNRGLMLLAAATLLLAGAEAWAEPTSKDNGRLAAALRQFPDADANGDGVLTLTEARAYQAKMKAEQARDSGRGAKGPAPTHADVKYGPHARNVLDFWSAAGANGAAGPRPVLVYMHGGGFSGGDKKAGQRVVDRFVKAGISVASINYRLIDTAPYPGAMHDGARAIQFLRSKSAEWSIDPQRIGAMGGSAGGCMSLWLAFHDDLADPSSDDAVARLSSRVTCAAPVAAQTTLDVRTFAQWFGVMPKKEHPSMRGLFGIQRGETLDSPRVLQVMRDASPITHLTKDDPPVFMTYTTRDVKVTEDTNPGVWVHHPRLGIKLKEAMDAAGIECHLAYPGGAKPNGYEDAYAFVIDKLTATAE